MASGAYNVLSVVDPAPAAPTPAPTDGTDFKLGSFSVDEYRPIRVAVIGAGFSGVTAAIRFRQKVPNVSLTVYDKLAGVGGTWYANKYPGLACDIPSHCYQLTFETKHDWSAMYAPGPEIRTYIEHVVHKWKLEPLIKLEHELVRAEWDDALGKWKLGIKPPGEAEPFEDIVDVLFTGVGGLSRWSWPDIPGLSDFKGRLLHSANWDVTDGPWEEGVKDWGDKRVGVIGVGASALQIVPALQPKVKTLVNYVRGRTWVAAPFAEQKFAELMGINASGSNYHFTEADVKRLNDPEHYKRFRHELESDLNSVHSATLKGTPMQNGAREAFAAQMQTRLAKKPWIFEKIKPDFAVACRRLTPGPGYLEAICEDNVVFQTELIQRVTPSGIETADGQHAELDVIVCATGFNTSFNLGFPFLGRGGVDLAEKFTPHPRTYLTVAVDDFPNWFMSLGPNSGVGSGSLLVLIERQIDYAVQATLKLQRERLKSIEPKKEAVADFDEYLEHYFPTSVYSEKCRSWYKQGKEEGRVVGLWPGSCLHAVRALAHPRWEDFHYEPIDGVRNRFHWLGDGQTYNEKTLSGDRAWYLLPSEVDVPPVPEEEGEKATAETKQEAKPATQSAEEDEKRQGKGSIKVTKRNSIRGLPSWLGGKKRTAE